MVCQGNFINAFLSKSPMNRLANAGAIRVPIAVPCRCIKWSLLKTKLFMVKIMRMRSHITGFCRNGFFGPFTKSYILRASITSLVEMFVSVMV